MKILIVSTFIFIFASLNVIAEPKSIIEIPFTAPTEIDNYVLVVTEPKELGICILSKQMQVVRGQFTQNSMSYYSSRITKLIKHIRQSSKICGTGMVNSSCIKERVSASDVLVIDGYMRAKKVIDSSNPSPFELDQYVSSYCGSMTRI